MKKATMGMIIAEKRKELGMTQLQLADKMSVTDKAVSKWERNLAYPDVESIPKLAEILGVSVDTLMQIKTEAISEEEKTKMQDIFLLIPKAVCVAMGIAVTVLSVLREIDADKAVLMLGIGVACAGISFLQRK